MSDIVQRLRDSATQARALDRAALLHEAADEIERLRLTNPELQALLMAIGWSVEVRDAARYAATLRGLLERLK